jgi:hypothetical protein
MKNIGLASAFLLLAGLPFSAAPAQDNHEARQAPQPAAAQKEPLPHPAPKLVMHIRSRAAPPDVDARECLRFETNGEVRTCAEKYR